MCGTRKENDKRITAAIAKCSSAYKKRRTILRHERKSKPSDKINYLSGAFSVKNVSDKPINCNKSKSSAQPSLLDDELCIAFVDERFIDKVYVSK